MMRLRLLLLLLFLCHFFTSSHLTNYPELFSLEKLFLKQMQKIDFDNKNVHRKKISKLNFHKKYLHKNSFPKKKMVIERANPPIAAKDCSPLQELEKAYHIAAIFLINIQVETNLKIKQLLEANIIFLSKPSFDFI